MSLLKQKGTSTVEFAFVLPLLLLLVVMVSEFGTMLYRKNAVTKSVQIAARYLSDNAVGNSNTITEIGNAKNLAVYGNIAGSGVAVAPNFTPSQIVVSNPDAQHVQVTASYSYDSLGASLNALMQLATGSGSSADSTLNASSVMRFAQ